jgi:hypothetical protein
VGETNSIIPENAICPEHVYKMEWNPNQPDGVFRLAYGNIDRFSTVAFNNPKANLLKHWIQNIGADFFWVMRSGSTGASPHSGWLPEIFHTENTLRMVAGYNTHKNFHQQQYGGTFQLTFGALAAWVVDTGVNDRQLGGYVWTKFHGWNGHVAQIVLIYVPCKASRSSGDHL